MFLLLSLFLFSFLFLLSRCRHPPSPVLKCLVLFSGAAFFVLWYARPRSSFTLLLDRCGGRFAPVFTLSIVYISVTVYNALLRAYIYYVSVISGVILPIFALQSCSLIFSCLKCISYRKTIEKGLFFVNAQIGYNLKLCRCRSGKQKSGGSQERCRTRSDDQ